MEDLACTYFCMAPKERRKKGVASMLYTGTGYKVKIKSGHL